MQKNETPHLRFFPSLEETEKMKEAALEKSEQALDTLVLNSIAGDPLASEALCSVLQSRLWALHRIGWLFFDESHGPILQALIAILKFNIPEYQNSVNEQPHAYLPFLCNLADFGHLNIRNLLVELVRNGSDEIFFIFVGIAGIGSFWALNAINEGGNERHFQILAQSAEDYGANPHFKKVLLSLIQNYDFRPKCYLEKADNHVKPMVIQYFAKLGAPFAIELLQNGSMTVH